VTGLFETNSLHIVGADKAVGARGVFDRMSTAVRRDLFSNTELVDTDTQEIMVVTTVLAKHEAARRLTR